MNGASPASSYITADGGVRLYYEASGSGDTTLIIPNGICLSNDFRIFGEKRRLIAYDPRNRGRSDTITDTTKLAGGIHNDVDDLDAVRRHLGAERIDLIGHSYIGVLVILYAMKYPQHVNRVVQIGAPPPHADAQYPAHLTAADGVVASVFSKMGQLQKELACADPVEACRRFWELLRVMYVADEKDAAKLDWMRCDLPNERNFMAYWAGQIAPSINALRFIDEDFAKVIAPVLTIHGTRDRSAPYGGGRDWVMRLSNARLLTVQNAAHAPWIEAPERVFGAIDAFLAGNWPKEAEAVAAA